MQQLWVGCRVRKSQDAGQEAILAGGGVTTRNDASSSSHIHGKKSTQASPGTQVYGDCLGTVIPCLPLDLVPDFSFSGSFPQTPFLPLCFLPAFFLHPRLLFLLGSSGVAVDLL